MTITNLILIGFSGTGKSAVGNAVARRLGWTFVDIDDEVIRLAGKPVATIFEEDGETRFRELESKMIEQACSEAQQVIATGGGALIDLSNQEIILGSGMVVTLEASPETIANRLAHATGDNVRPLLRGDDVDVVERVRALKRGRQSLYALGHWVVSTDNLSIEEVANEVLRGWSLSYAHAVLPTTSERRVESGSGAEPSIIVTSAGVCPIFVGWNLLSDLGLRMREVGLSGSAFLVSDENVAANYVPLAQRSLETHGFPTQVYILSAGESSKDLKTAEKVYNWLASQRAERGDVIVALGGGVVGDLAGFVAATFGRGMPFVQVPTSLAAMVDASIGGKVAVNLPEGKNLVGAFHQPRLILSDPQTLMSLPEREAKSGWAEAIKHGLILDRDLFHFLETEVDALLGLDPQKTVHAIRWSAAVKASVVSRDERETRGLRTLLNYGHTIGHALEATTKYGRFLHGEAVAIGMRGAAMISHRIGVIHNVEVLKRQEAIMERFGLPNSCNDVDLRAIQEAMKVDKKIVGGQINWVLLESLGHAVIKDDVPFELSLEVVEQLIRED
jgi:shikimate kinase/3-dehydroquinate synthase